MFCGPGQARVDRSRADSAGEVYSSTNFNPQMLRQTSGALASLMAGSRQASWDIVARPSGITLAEQQEESDSDGPGTGRNGRKPQMQGRFSGRLALKEDEKRLAEECRLLGPMLGGVGKRTDKSRLTLAKIVRGIACGSVRRHCEERDALLEALKSRVIELETMLPAVERMQEQMLLMRAELDVKDKRLAELEPDVHGLSRVVRMAQQQQLARKQSYVDPIASSLGQVAPNQMMAPGPSGGNGTLVDPFPMPANCTGPLAGSGVGMPSAAAMAAAAMALKRRSSGGAVSNQVPNMVGSAGLEGLPDGSYAPSNGNLLGGGHVMSSNALAGLAGGMTGGMGGAPLALEHGRVSGSGSGLVPGLPGSALPPTGARPPLATSRSLTAPLGAAPACNPAAPPAQERLAGSGSLQSPFCINIPTGTGTGDGRSASFNMEVLLAQHNAALASAGSAQQQQQQGAAVHNAGFTGLAPSSGSGRVQLLEPMARSGSRNLPFPDMARSGSGGGVELGGTVPGFGNIKIGGLNIHQAPGTVDEGSNWGQIGPGEMAAFSSGPSRLQEMSGVGDLPRRVSTTDNASAHDRASGGSGTHAGNTAVAEDTATAVPQADGVACGGAGGGRGVAGAEAGRASPSQDSRRNGQAGANGSPGGNRGAKRPGVEEELGLAAAAAKRARTTGQGTNSGGGKPVSSPRDTVDALHMLGDAALTDTTGGERRAAAAEAHGQHVPSTQQDENRDSPQLASRQQQRAGTDGLAAQSPLQREGSLSQPAQLQAAAAELPAQQQQQLVSAGDGGADAGPQLKQQWGGHYSLAAQQQNFEAVQGSLLPLPVRSNGSNGNHGLASLSSAPSWLQQLQQHNLNSNSGGNGRTPTSAPSNSAHPYLPTLTTVAGTPSRAALMQHQKAQLDALQVKQQQQLDALQAQQQRQLDALQSQQHLDQLQVQQVQIQQQRQLDALQTQQQMDAIQMQQQQQQQMDALEAHEQQFGASFARSLGSSQHQPSPFSSGQQQQCAALQGHELAAAGVDGNVAGSLSRGMSTEGLAFNNSQGLYMQQTMPSRPNALKQELGGSSLGQVAPSQQVVTFSSLQRYGDGLEQQQQLDTLQAQQAQHQAQQQQLDTLNAQLNALQAQQQQQQHAVDLQRQQQLEGGGAMGQTHMPRYADVVEQHRRQSFADLQQAQQQAQQQHREQMDGLSGQHQMQRYAEAIEQQQRLQNFPLEQQPRHQTVEGTGGPHLSRFADPVEQQRQHGYADLQQAEGAPHHQMQRYAEALDQQRLQRYHMDPPRHPPVETAVITHAGAPYSHAQRYAEQALMQQQQQSMLQSSNPGQMMQPSGGQGQLMYYLPRS